MLRMLCKPIGCVPARRKVRFSSLIYRRCITQLPKAYSTIEQVGHMAAASKTSQLVPTSKGKHTIAIIGASIAGSTFALQILRHPILSSKYHPVLFDSANHLPGLSEYSSHEGQVSGAAFALTIQALYPLYNILGDELKEIAHDNAQVKIWRQPLFGTRDLGKPWTYVARMISPGRLDEDIGGLMGIERADLQAALIERIVDLGGQISIGKRLDTVRQFARSKHGDGPIELAFSDKTSIRCALLVGADGAWSRVRRSLFTEGASVKGSNEKTVDEGWQPNFSHGTMLYGVSNMSGPSDAPSSSTTGASLEEETGHGMCMRSTGVSTVPLKHGKHLWHLWSASPIPPPYALEIGKKAEVDQSLSRKYNTFFSNGGYEPEETEAFLDRHRNVWHPDAGTYGKLFECSEKVIRIPLYDKIWDRISNCTWTAAESKAHKLKLKDLGPRNGMSNTVLIGDAAKMILPSSGQGAGTAIEDATVLANYLLNNPPDYPHDKPFNEINSNSAESEHQYRGDPCFETALKRYTADRLPRYRDIATFSNWTFKLSLGRWWWERILRDYVPGWIPDPVAKSVKEGKEEERRLIRQWAEGGGGKGRWDEWGMQKLLGPRYEVKLEGGGKKI